MPKRRVYQIVTVAPDADVPVRIGKIDPIPGDAVVAALGSNGVVPVRWMTKEEVKALTSPPSTTHTDERMG